MATAIAQPAKADRNIVLSLLPLQFVNIETAQAEVVESNDIRLSSFQASTEHLDFDVSGLRVLRQSGLFDVSFNRLTIRENSGERRAFQTSGTLKLRDLPGTITGASMLCRYADSLVSADFGETVVDWSGRPQIGGPTDLQQARFSTVSVSQGKTGSPCHFDGQLSGADFSLSLRGGQQITIKEASLALSSPLSAATARRDGDTKASLRLGSIDSRLDAEVPLAAMRLLRVATSMPAARSVGFLFLLENYLAAADKPDPDQLMLELWNAYTISQASTGLEINGANLFLPSILPRSVIAPYGKAALSYVMGNAKAQMVMSGAKLNISSTLSLNGLFDATAETVADINAIPRDQISLVTSGQSDLTDLEMLSLSSAKIQYLDTGLDVVVKEIFGLPLGRLISELSGVTGDASADAPFLGGLSYGFREAAHRAPVVFHLAAPSPNALRLPLDLEDLRAGATKNVFRISTMKVDNQN